MHAFLPPLSLHPPRFPTTSSLSSLRPLVCTLTPPSPLTTPTTAKPSPPTNPPTSTTTPPRPPTPSSSADTSAPPPPISEISGVQEYLAVLDKYQSNLIVLKVYAPWCRSCRALQPKLARLAREFPEVRFLKMNYEENKPLCYRLGVCAMPTFVLYKGEDGEIDKFSCGPQRAGIIREHILAALGKEEGGGEDGKGERQEENGGQ